MFDKEFDKQGVARSSDPLTTLQSKYYLNESPQPSAQVQVAPSAVGLNTDYSDLGVSIDLISLEIYISRKFCLC
jgi:hypothetical protein